MEETKNICIFSAQYLPSIGGVERYTAHIADNLKERGYKVTIVTSDLYGAPLYEEEENVRIYRLPSIGCMNNRFPVVKFNCVYKKAIKEIFRGEYDLVIVNTRFYVLSLVGAYLGHKYGKHCICIEHGTMHLTLQQPILNILEEVFEHTITALVKHYIKAFYGVSRACNEWLHHFRIDAKSVLYNSIDIEEINAIVSSEKINIKEKYRLPKDGIIITFTGRLLKEKGILQLLEAFKRLRKDFPNTFLVIAGEGPLIAELKYDTANGVYFLGRISYEEVILLLDKSEIFCLPSDSEGMPTSVLEAIACKNFVITTKKGGAKEILLDTSYGIVLEDNEVEKVYNALFKAVKEPEYRLQAACKSYKMVCSNFTWKVVIDELEKIASGDNGR